MSTLQVKNLPPSLHAALAERARAEGMSMSDYVSGLLERDLSRPTMREWLQRRRATAGPIHDIDSVGAVDAARREYDDDDRVSSS